MFGKVKRLERDIEDLERLVKSHREDYWELVSLVGRLMNYLDVYDEKVEEFRVIKRHDKEVSGCD